MLRKVERLYRAAICVSEECILTFLISRHSYRLGSTTASGGVSVEAHEVAIQRTIAAGANVMTWLALAGEWQPDWARIDTATGLVEVLKEHAAGSGIAYLWEQQLLNTQAPT